MTDAIPEEQQSAPSPAHRWRRWLLFSLIGGLALICLCVAAVGWSRVKVTPATQRLAQQALLNPNSATLHLGQYGDSNLWRQASPTDYAVQDGMVIFPRLTDLALSSWTVTGDVRLSVLVYAPDGSNLTLRPGPPAGRGWFYGNEWVLYNCRPRLIDPLWWDCMLLVGGNI